MHENCTFLSTKKSRACPQLLYAKLLAFFRFFLYNIRYVSIFLIVFPQIYISYY